MKVLPQTGTVDLLEKLSPYLDDVFLNDLLPGPLGLGRRRKFYSAQLFRVLLLGLLTPAHSFNLLLKLLPENRAWRRFAHLRNQREIPDAKMLHLFRDRLDLRLLRQLNAQLLRPLLEQLDPDRKALAIMDATDLPAAANSFKKTRLVCLPNMRLSGLARSRPARAVGLSATKNIACGCGCHNGVMPYYWCP